MQRRKRQAERFIPFRKKDIIEMCLSEKHLDDEARLQFRNLVLLLQSTFHYQLHGTLENLKDAYAPVNPERDTRRVELDLPSPDIDFVATLESLLDNANYEKLTNADLQQAFDESSLFNLRLMVDFNDFAEVLVFARGESAKTETVPLLYGLIKKEVSFSNFDRVVLYIKFSDEIEQGLNHKPGATLLKLFQNVPKSDIEMLFPNTRLGMRLVDKLMIGVPAVVGGGIVLTTKVGTSLLLMGTLVGFWIGVHAEPVTLDQTTVIALAAAIGALGSFIWKQFVNFKNRKLTFMQSLTENLYFKNLDNNAGVLHRLIDEAEEEECKEAMLAYYFLLTRGGCAVSYLDEGIESWFQTKWDAVLDFEVDDAVNKLRALDLVTESYGQLSARPLDQALRILDERWDNLFSFEASAAEIDQSGLNQQG